VIPDHESLNRPVNVILVHGFGGIRSAATEFDISFIGVSTQRTGRSASDPACTDRRRQFEERPARAERAPCSRTCVSIAVVRSLWRFRSRPGQQRPTSANATQACWSPTVARNPGTRGTEFSPRSAHRDSGRRTSRALRQIGGDAPRRVLVTATYTRTRAINHISLERTAERPAVERDPVNQWTNHGRVCGDDRGGFTGRLQ
jgi:hypothetical protein